MPSWPDGVTTTTLLFGKGISVGGNMTSARLSVEPIFQGTDAVVWQADGTPMLPFSEQATADDGSYGSIQVPVVNQTGWLDSGQHPYTLWGYKLTETPSYGRAPGRPRVKYWQPLTGQTTVDFDLIPDGSLGLPSSGPVAVVTSVNGQTGAVIVAGGDGAPDSAVAALVTNTNSATRAALAATYVQFKQAAKNPDLLIVGAITRNASGVITSAAVVWPDGTVGTFTTDLIDASGAINGYHITYGSPATKTYTQPTITRDSTGAATAVPQITVA